MYAGPGATLKQRLAELEGAYAHAKRSLDAMCKSAERGALEGSGGAETSQDFSGALPPTDSDWDLSTTAASGGEPSQRLGGGQDCPVSVLNWNIVEDWRAVLPLSRWTTVTADETLLNHLFALFWTWDHSLARILHRELLLDGLTADTQGPGRPDTRFCSEFLINSILAVSTVRRRACADPWERALTDEDRAASTRAMTSGRRLPAVAALLTRRSDCSPSTRSRSRCPSCRAWPSSLCMR